MAKIPVIGAVILRCDKCDKYNKAIDIYNMFSWEYGYMGYDKKNNEILIAEEDIMHAIQMVNPMQEARNIRIVSRKELMERKFDKNISR